MSKNFSGFPRDTLKFLQELKQNNKRDWFLAHKHIYESKVKAPMIDYVLALKSELKTFAKELLVDPTRCIFRIYRDVRFSQDKSPYKTNIAAFFDPADMQKRAAAGLYVHFAPEDCFIGGGIYHAPSPELLAIRTAIAKSPQKIRKIIDAPEFKKTIGGFQGDQLSRVPRGFPQDHPAADLLRFKNYVVLVKLKPELVESSKIVPETVRYFKVMMPLVRYLNGCLKQMPRKLRG